MAYRNVEGLEQLLVNGWWAILNLNDSAVPNVEQRSLVCWDFKAA